MANLSLPEIRKRAGRIETLLNKLAKQTPFETSKGPYTASMLVQYRNKQVHRIYHPADPRDFADAVKALDTVNDTYMIASADDAGGMPLTQLVKSAEFGGKGAGGGLLAESRAISQMQEAIENAIKENKGPISIKVKGATIPNIVDVVKTDGTPKSDFHLVDTSGNAVIWISHKDGRGPKDFQQWGGISQRSEPKIFAHKETQQFIADLKARWPDGLPRATTVYRTIKDKQLKMWSVYGNQYGSKQGEQNVSVLLQGPPGLERQGQVYVFTANHVHFNGDSVDDGGFEPVLMAIYKGDRSDAGVKGTRIVISPIMGRKGVPF